MLTCLKKLLSDIDPWSFYFIVYLESSKVEPAPVL